MRSLYWFRSDFRLSDNPAFDEAVHASDELIALYILTPETWLAHNAAPCKIQFVLQNLSRLSDALSLRGISLLIRTVPRFSECSKVIEALCEQHKINALYFNAEYPVDETRRDEAVKDCLGSQVKVHVFHGHLVIRPGDLLNKQGKPFQVFTPFKKAWLALAHDTQCFRTGSASKKKFKLVVKPDLMPHDISGFDEQSIKVEWPAGEAAAKKTLKRFCEQRIQVYQQNRDFPAIKGTSALSPYLTQGVISPRQCITAALEAADLQDIDCLSKNEGVSTWVSELVWREFYHHIVFLFPEVCRHQPFRPKTDLMPWGHNEKLIEAWKQGNTGFPIVDAGMRQLNQTGWMHNRLRMITAMFFSKILQQDWRVGERYFMSKLIDGDFAANNGGWQWCASTGTDSVPYFRIFNPTTQSERFDASGEFIRQYCPELSAVKGKKIHAPLAGKGATNGIDYPQPIVDYKDKRAETLENFKQLSLI